MQKESTAPPIQPPAVSPMGVLFLYSPNLALKVRYGSLEIDLGRGRTLRVSRASEPRLRRLVLCGYGGWMTLAVPQWIAGIGASWLHIDLLGNVLGSGPGGISPDLPALRRAQALASGSAIGLTIGRELLTAKLAGQAAALHGVPGADAMREVILADGAAIGGCPDSKTLRGVEADAANAFWRAVSDVPMQFVKADRDNVPKSWLIVGRRSSILSGSPRSASSAAHAVWNFAYSLAATEVGTCLRAVGLDPGISPTGLHADTPNREGATWDVLEPVRGEIDRAIIEMLADRRFRRRDFVERPTGGVRLTAPLARNLAEAILPLAREVAGPLCEGLARTLAETFDGPRSHVKMLPTNLTGDARSRGRNGIRSGARKPKKTAQRAGRSLRSSACPGCGLLVEGAAKPGTYCPECFPALREEVVAGFIGAGTRSLAGMRSAESDPSRTPAAKAKARATAARTRAENKEWEQTHELPDPAEWDAIAEGLADVSVGAIQRATGLALSTSWEIKKGGRRTHPRHWEVLRDLSQAGPRPGRVSAADPVD